VSNDKQPAPQPPMILRSFHLQPGCQYAPGCYGYSSLDHWNREKHGDKLKCEERPNGDVWLTNPYGARIEISVLAISYKVRGPETLKQSEAVRRGA